MTQSIRVGHIPKIGDIFWCLAFLSARVRFYLILGTLNILEAVKRAKLVNFVWGGNRGDSRVYWFNRNEMVQNW